MEVEKRGAGPLIPLDVASAGGGGACNTEEGFHMGHLPMFLHLQDQKQQSEHRAPVFGGQGPYCPRWLPKAAHKLLQELLHSCLPCG